MKSHCGLLLSTNRDQHTFNVLLVDSGCVEALPHNMLFKIPPELMAYRLFSTSVALVEGEALSLKPGLNEIFASLVLSLDVITCEVVNAAATHPTVHLYDVKGQNIAEIVLRMYHSLVPKFKALASAPLTLPKIEIPEPQLNSIEKLYVMVRHRVGRFFGQLLSRSTSELVDISSHLRDYYEANPQALRLDAGGRQIGIGQIAVLKWSQDGQYYRPRILNATGSGVEIQFVDFGDVITVPRQDLFAPVASSRFSQPAFGINCRLSRDGAADLKKEEWDAVLLEKSIEVKIVNKNEDGSYTVSFTLDPYNHAVLERLYPHAAALLTTVPTGTYDFLDTAHQSVTVAVFYSFERFFLTPIDVSIYKAELEPLNEFYASLAPNELVEDTPSVGLPCVVKFKDDGKFYRSQILSILPDHTAQILFVDYGNEQITLLSDIKRIVPKFMKLPQLVWPCQRVGFQLSPGVDELIAKVLSVDNGVHRVTFIGSMPEQMLDALPLPSKKSGGAPSKSRRKSRKIETLEREGFLTSPWGRGKQLVRGVVMQMRNLNSLEDGG